MLAFSKKTGYALIAMLHLAKLDEGDLASSREIAERFSVPAYLLKNVMKELAAAGFVSSVRGAHGGYSLTRLPEDIDLAEVVTALEGPIRLAECIKHRGQMNDKVCKIMGHCPVEDPVHRVQRKLRDFLKTVTLEDIVRPTDSKDEG